MDPNYLLKDELEYELASRSIKVRSTVPVMKKLLKELMLCEQSEGHAREIKAPSGSAHTSDFEIEICSAKLNVLANYISEIAGKPDRVLFKRLVSRLYHVENRLNLVQQEKEDQAILVDGLKEQCHRLLEKLEVQDEVIEDENLTSHDKQVLHETLGDLGLKIIDKLENRPSTSKQLKKIQSEGEENRGMIGEHIRNVSFSTCQWNDGGGVSRGRLMRTSTVDEDFPRRKLVPIYQWGLKFSGTSNMSVNAFLERVSELRDARNASDMDLWRYAIDFFEGDALIWYRANKEYADSWEDLVILLKRTFQRPFYQEELLAEINARTQGDEESVLIYIAVMQNMFNRLPNKLTEKEKIVIVLKNLQPYYQRAVCRDEFSSIPDLINVLRIIERTKVNCDNFQQPKVGKNTLEPDLAYKIASEVIINDTKEMVEVTEIKARTNPAQRCWNCRESGHRFRECRTPKQRLFCYRCGRFGVTSQECRCKGNALGGNSSSGSEAVGEYEPRLRGRSGCCYST